MMCLFYPGYVGRTPDELLRTNYSSVTAVEGRIQGALGAAGSSSSSAAPATSRAKWGGRASRAVDPGSETSRLAAPAAMREGSRRRRGHFVAAHEAAPALRFKAPPPKGAPPSETSRLAGAGAPMPMHEELRPRQEPLQEHEPAPRLERPARATLRTAQEVEADRIAENRRRAEAFAVQRPAPGASSGSAAGAAPAAAPQPQDPLWTNYRGVGLPKPSQAPQKGRPDPEPPVFKGKGGKFKGKERGKSAEPPAGWPWPQPGPKGDFKGKGGKGCWHGRGKGGGGPKGRR
jgi:hypothetical protein